jgi:hypothetical protein
MFLKCLFIIYLLIIRHFAELFSLSETESISVPITRIKVKERAKKRRGKITEEIKMGRKKG